MYRFRPKILDAISGLTREQLLREVTAGVIVGVVALPLAIAFAIASGVTPRQGLITAVIAGAIISGLGGSRVQIGGPTGAFVVLVAATIERHGIDGLLLATVMAGIILIVGGLLGAGALIRYIPLPVITGFTSGIAVVIAVGQLADAGGMAIARMPAAFLPRLDTLARAVGTTDALTIGVALGTLAILVGWPRLKTPIPAPFVALLLVTAGCALLDLPVATIGSRFGALPSGIPMPSIPLVSVARLPELFGPACTIALLAAIESLLSAVVADSMTGGRHRANTELVALGIANIASPLFGGIPATGAIARTATNIRSGGKTPIAGLVHAATLLLILMVAGTMAAMIPLAALAAILLVVAWHMGEWPSFLRLARGGRQDAAVLLTTFAFTVMADLTVGIGVGMAIAALLFVQRMSKATEVITGDDMDDDSAAILRRASLPADVQLIEVRGPLFFGGAEKLRLALGILPERPRVLVVDLTAASGLDVTTTRILADFARKIGSEGTRVIFVTRDTDATQALQRDGLERALSVERAVERTKMIPASSEPPAAGD